MAVLCKPVVEVPKYSIDQKQTIDMCNLFHGHNKDVNKILRMIRNTGIKKRHIIQPLSETLVHRGVEKRHKIYCQEAKKLALDVCNKALEVANLSARDIDLIIATSCTGFLFPSLTAYLINELKMRSNTKQLPIAQLGCAAGGAAINRAADYCKAYPDRNVLIVSVELCSLLYQPTDNDFGVLVSNALFGDAASACVMTSHAKEGVKIETNDSFLYSNSEHYITYDVKETGFHFKLDKAVPKTMEVIAPILKEFISSQSLSFSDVDLFAIHAGGPRILNDLVRLLDLLENKMIYSRESLANYGNTASVFIFDAIRRMFEDKKFSGNERVLIAGFGPGLTAEFNLGRMVNNN